MVLLFTTKDTNPVPKLHAGGKIIHQQPLTQGFTKPTNPPISENVND